MQIVWNLVLAVQIISAITMIGLVLVQHGKGADMGASFGSGASGSLFGATGSANFLSRSTAVCATVFFICTLALAYASHRLAAGRPDWQRARPRCGACERSGAGGDPLRLGLDGHCSDARAKIVFINPSYSKNDTLGPFAEYITAQLPLSLGFLAGYLLERHISAEIIDEQLRQVNEDELGALIASGQVRIIGISVLTLTSARAYELGRMIKRRWPQVTVVMGGVHVTLLPEEPLELGVADIIVRSEGEVTFHQIVDRLMNGRPYHDVAGISCVREGGVVHNPERPLVADLDSLPVGAGGASGRAAWAASAAFSWPSQ